MLHINQSELLSLSLSLPRTNHNKELLLWNKISREQMEKRQYIRSGQNLLVHFCIEIVSTVYKILIKILQKWFTTGLSKSENSWLEVGFEPTTFGLVVRSIYWAIIEVLGWQSFRTSINHAKNNFWIREHARSLKTDFYTKKDTV